VNRVQHKKTSQRARQKQARLAHPAKAPQSHVVAEGQPAAPAAAAKRAPDSLWVRTASSLGVSAAVGMVTAATFPAAPVVLPIGLAALGAAVVAMIGRHQAG
jgi:hypothetical protein